MLLLLLLLLDRALVAAEIPAPAPLLPPREAAEETGARKALEGREAIAATARALMTLRDGMVAVVAELSWLNLQG